MSTGRNARPLPRGLSRAQARERLARFGPNELVHARRPSPLHELAGQLTHPLALLLWAAAALALLTESPTLAIVIVLVLALNAAFAIAQEQQADRAVEALAHYLPAQARVRRNGRALSIPATQIVPGDALLIAAGERISADADLIAGSIDVDASPLTGESQPVLREPRGGAPDVDWHLHSGTLCVAGEGMAIVTATGMHTELGRIAMLSQRVRAAPSPLERQVRRAAVLIAIVSVVLGLSFVPLGMVLAGLPSHDTLLFGIGLLVANVPEGLLPTITLSLAVGVRLLARKRALVKRLSAVETLGSTGVICTDKTGTLTEDRLEPRWVHTVADGTQAKATELSSSARETVRAAAVCNDADLDDQAGTADPTERALLELAHLAGEHLTRQQREQLWLVRFPFDPSRRLMTVVVRGWGGRAGNATTAVVKGAPEAVIERCTDDGMPEGWRESVMRVVADGAGNGMRLLACARRTLPAAPDPGERDSTERELEFLGIIALEDALRAEVPAAVATCRSAGIRIVVITGDHPRTAHAIACEAGIVDRDAIVLTGDEIDSMGEQRLRMVLADPRGLVAARSSPETKLHIARELQQLGLVVAMTGDGVNDAPALRRADIGIAMGRSGTDVAREAADMVLTDDNFATIAEAVEEGRRVYANLRKFITYVFAHTTPEAVPFLLFALTGGAIPLPLTAAQVLAIDLGTETLPALALGREPAEPGLMRQPPRPRSEGIISGEMLVRAYLFLGVISAALVVAAFLIVLVRAGWHPGDATGPGTRLHDAYLQATTVTFLSIVACQVGTVFACRSERESLRSIGVASNRLIFWGILFELCVAAAITWIPALHGAFGTASIGVGELMLVAPMPIVVWGADELRRLWIRRSSATKVHEPRDGAG